MLFMQRGCYAPRRFAKPPHQEDAWTLSQINFGPIWQQMLPLNPQMILHIRTLYIFLFKKKRGPRQGPLSQSCTEFNFQPKILHKILEKIGNNLEIDKVNQFLTGKTVFKVLLFSTLYRTAPVPGADAVSVGQQYLIIILIQKKALRPRPGPLSPELTQ